MRHLCCIKTRPLAHPSINRLPQLLHSLYLNKEPSKMVSKATVAILMAFYIASAAAKSSRVGGLKSDKVQVAGPARAICPCPEEFPEEGFDTSYCAGLPDGNYPHPFDCTFYVACTAGRAEQMWCGDDGFGGSLHYVADSGPREADSYCDYDFIAGCNCTCAGGP